MRGFDSSLTFQKLQVFCTVAELGSVTHAAERLFIAQPAVSAHIRGMEKRLGYTLLARSGRNIELTEAGKHVYRWANEVITCTHEIERELAGLQKGTFGSVVVTASMTIGSYMLPALVTRFYQQCPDGLVTVQISNPAPAVDAVRIGACDFAVVLIDPDRDLDDLAATQLWEEELLLVSAPDSRWISEDPDDIDLATVPFISAPRHTRRREIEDAQLRKQGVVSRRIILELGHPEAMKHAVRQDLGLCYMLASSVRADIARGELHVLKQRGSSMKLPIYLVHRSDKCFSAYQANLIDFIRQAAGEDIRYSEP